MVCVKAGCNRETKGYAKLCGYHRKGAMRKKSKRGRKVATVEQKHSDRVRNMFAVIITNYIDMRIEQTLRRMFNAQD